MQITFNRALRDVKSDGIYRGLMNSNIFTSYNVHFVDRSHQVQTQNNSKSGWDSGHFPKPLLSWFISLIAINGSQVVQHPTSFVHFLMTFFLWSLTTWFFHIYHLKGPFPFILYLHMPPLFLGYGHFNLLSCSYISSLNSGIRY